MWHAVLWQLLRSRANGAASGNAVAVVSVQADQASPARTRTAAESTTSPIVAAVSTGIDGNGSRLNGRPTDTAHANRSRHRKGLPCVICGAVGVGVGVAGCRSRANGAARCNAVALVVMQAGRVSPARTRTAAEPTMCSAAAAVSTDNDGRPTGTHTGAATCNAVALASMQAGIGYRQHGHGRQAATEAAALPCVCHGGAARQLLSRPCAQPPPL